MKNGAHYKTLRMAKVDFKNKISREFLNRTSKCVTPPEWLKYATVSLLEMGPDLTRAYF